MSRSTLSRSLEPLAAALWGIFLAWTVLLAAVWVGGVDAAWLQTNLGHAELRLTAEALVQSVVPTWLALAVANMHLSLTRAEGLRTARRWLFLTLVAALALGILARARDLPFGPFDFKDSLGPRLLGVPIGWTLLWFVLVAGARELVLWVRPRLGHRLTVLASTVLVGLSLATLQPLVAHEREGFRFWLFGRLGEPDVVPWYAPVAAVAFAGALGWFMREMRLFSGTQRSRRPAVTFLILNALLLATALRLWLTGR